jgi:hypothetical protein
MFTSSFLFSAQGLPDTSLSMAKRYEVVSHLAGWQFSVYVEWLAGAFLRCQTL